MISISVSGPRFNYHESYFFCQSRPLLQVEKKVGVKFQSSSMKFRANRHEAFILLERFIICLPSILFFMLK